MRKDLPCEQKEGNETGSGKSILLIDKNINSRALYTG